MAVPAIAIAAARLLPLALRLGGSAGPALLRFAPNVGHLMNQILTNAPGLLSLGAGVATFAATSPATAQVAASVLPGAPHGAAGAAALAQPSAAAVLRDAWTGGARPT